MKTPPFYLFKCVYAAGVKNLHSEKEKVNLGRRRGVPSSLTPDKEFSVLRETPNPLVAQQEMLS